MSAQAYIVDALRSPTGKRKGSLATVHGADLGAHVIKADGHDFGSIKAAFAEARTVKGQPTVILAKTVKGKGVSFMENQAGWHGKAPNAEQYTQAKAELEAKIAELEG